MKKFTFLLAFVLLATSVKINAQEENNEPVDLKRECTIKYNLFKGDYQSKKYDEAYTNWIYLMDNCKDLSVSIYQYGSDIAENVKKDPALAKRVYEQRLQYYPNENPAKVHSDYAAYLAESKLATDDEIFNILKKGYDIDPTKMGVKNLYRYFQGVTSRNKDTNPQYVFDTYDDVLENVGLKLEGYAAKIKELTADSTRVLDKREKSLLRAYTVNSKAIGSIEPLFDRTITKIANCENLVPLYQKDFEANKTNEIWLKRAVSRMFKKECQEDPLFEKLVRAYAEASPSPEAYAFLANVLEDNGDNAGAADMRLKSFELETDPLKKSKIKLKFAQAAKSRGQLSKARSLAYEAIKYNPNSGRAYLFIATLYQSSVNSCGKGEFEKRMIYVAALNKAERALAVDPSMSSVARKYIKTYKANTPSKKIIFQKGVEGGSPYKIGCWINETVKVPVK